MRKRFTISIVCFLSIFSISNLFAETIDVGLEPFPPLIVDENSGYTVDILKEIESISDLKFNIKIMPYIRAKRMLNKGQIDLMAHTPFGAETKDFYGYAQELPFKIPTRNAIFSMNSDHFNEITKKKIGVPRGNEAFLSEMTGIPIENFYLGEIENLLKMLNAGRIDLFWFEFGATMSTIKSLNIQNVHYLEYPEQQINAGLAVRKDEKGNKLKNELTHLLEKIDQKRILKDYLIYLDLPPKGIVH